MTTMTRFVPFRSPLDGVAILQNRLNSIFNDFAANASSRMKASVPATSFLRSISTGMRTSWC